MGQEFLKFKSIEGVEIWVRESSIVCFATGGYKKAVKGGDTGYEVEDSESTVVTLSSGTVIHLTKDAFKRLLGLS